MSSHWCYRCNKFVTDVSRLGMPVCPDCDSGFVEELEHSTRYLHTDGGRQRYNFIKIIPILCINLLRQLNSVTIVLVDIS